MAGGTLTASPRSKVGGDALDLPVPVADGVEFAAAAARLRRPLHRRAVAFGTAGGGLGERALGRGRKGRFSRPAGRGLRGVWLAHSLYNVPSAGGGPGPPACG